MSELLLSPPSNFGVFPFKVDLLFLKTCLPGQAGGDADNDLIDQLRRENRSLKQQV